MKDLNEKLNSIAKGTSTWKEKAKWRQANQEWLNKSAEIALKIVRTLREKGLTQKFLADSLGVSPQQVSKIIKGNENLTLETISKIEKVLEVNIISVSTFSNRIDLMVEEDYSLNSYSWKAEKNIKTELDYKQYSSDVDLNSSDDKQAA